MDPAADSARLEGAAVLSSRTSLALLSFWALLVLLLFLPTPLRELLRRSTSSGTGATATHAGGGIPGVPTEIVRRGERDPAPTDRPAGETILDPHRSLTPFFAALARTEARERGAITRVLHYGDSLIDQDLITGALRAALQRRFGDGGHGFVLAGKAWRWYLHAGITLGELTEAWEHFRLVGGRVRDGRLGLGCAAIQSRAPRAWVQVNLSGETRASLVEVHYLRAPRGGTLEIAVDGHPRARLSTTAAAPAAGFHRLEVPDAPHRIRLTTTGTVRLFGLVLERSGPGITWENLPLISARLHQLTSLDRAHWSEQLAHRRPDLVVLQFGANDTISFGGNLERYGRQVRTALETIRQAVPRSGCLIVGPLDRLERDAQGGLRSPSAVRRVADAQRQAALAARCAFWDGQRAMGGAGSMRHWLRQGLAVQDMVHLSARGSDRFAGLLQRALEAAYQRHRSATPRDASHAVQ